MTRLLSTVSLATVLLAAGCGSMLQQSSQVHNAVESKNSKQVDKAVVAKDGSGKTITVYLEENVSDDEEAAIEATVRETVPDVNKVVVKNKSDVRKANPKG